MADNVTKFTLLVASGTVVLTANFPFPNTVGGSPLSPAPISLGVGGELTISSHGPDTPLDGWTINAVAGSCDIVMQF